MNRGIMTALAGIPTAVVLLGLMFWPRQSEAPTENMTEELAEDQQPFSTTLEIERKEPIQIVPAVSLGPTFAELSPSPYGDSYENERLPEPTENFISRVTKKYFGIFVEPDNSPVQPERFTGFHTGVDAEYEDAAGEVAVRSVAEGIVVAANHTGGYGGLVVVEHRLPAGVFTFLYGHLDPDTVPEAGAQVEAGDLLGYLGEGGTSETDGERKHLHLGVLKGERADLRGYVGLKEELNQWMDPISFF